MKHFYIELLLSCVLLLQVSSNQGQNCLSSHRCRLYDESCIISTEEEECEFNGQSFALLNISNEETRLNQATNLVQRHDPVSEWLKELLDVVLKDIIMIDVLHTKINNTATPFLDLSNIYESGFAGHRLPSKSVFEELLLSEHSRLEEMIATEKPDWSKSKVFSEARKIVTAEYQKIVATELMPVLVGKNKASSLSSLIKSEVEVSLTAEEIVLGLALLEMFEYNDKHNEYENWRQLVYFRSSERLRLGITPTNIDQLNEVATLAKGLGIKNFSSLQKRCPKLTFDKNYNRSSPLQISIGERPVDGELLGPTFCCYIYQVLSRMIAGDEFWFTNLYSSKQIIALESVSLSSLICQNFNKKLYIQKAALLLPTSWYNSPLLCSEIPHLDPLVLLSDDIELIDEDLELINKAVELAEEEVYWLQIQEENLYKNNRVAPSNSSRASPSFGKPNPASLEQAETSRLLELVTHKLNNLITKKRSKRSHLSYPISSYSGSSKLFSSKTVNKIVYNKIDEKKFSKPSAKIKNLSTYRKKTGKVSPPKEPTSCSKDKSTPCDDTYKYRSFSGRCNNLHNVNNGMAGTIFERLIPSEYQDGISSPRSMATRGRPLPNPRTVSQKIHTSQPTPDPQFTLTLMQWGQFIDHDLALTPIPRGHQESIIDCKSCKSGADHPNCYPILIPKGDPTFPPHTCMAFTRSLQGQTKIGPREHMNQVTHYLDGSMVYGSSICESEELRLHHSFLLRTSPNTLSHPGNPLKELLPMTRKNKECRAEDGQCFLAGDERVNEQPGLTTIHTVLVREHNRIAMDLSNINPHWSNETIYQETRKIVSALVQHITYNEFLPRILGPSTIKEFSLEPLSHGYYDGYISNCSAGIFTEFSTAAFRFGHSMIAPNLTMMTEEDLMTEGGGQQVPLRNHFNNPDLVRSGRVLDNLVRGLVMAPMEVVDNRISQELKDHLFEEKGRKLSGMDLPALNIQRGRDHGLPGYNKYREFCGLGRSQSFVFDEIPQAWIDELSGVYDHPDDVDLFPGLLAERKLSGASVGPTLACLIGIQFRYLRSCDRFWYESGDPYVRFTEDQLKSIRTETLSGLLCRNCDKPGRLPMTGMDKMERLTNPMTDCKDLKHLDLELWRENKT